MVAIRVSDVHQRLLNASQKLLIPMAMLYVRQQSQMHDY
uniref:Transposase n=1 Tax=Ascaris lumbricoides TaxID=6252 RepID=A0A0M3IG94_ASCLU